MRDIRRHPCDERRRRKAEEVKAEMRVERRGQFRTRQADSAAGHALPGKRDLRHDRGETERRHREIKCAKPQRRQSDDHAEHGTATPAIPSAAKTGTGGSTLPADENARGVSAEREQRDISDRELTGETDDQIERADQHPIDGGARRDQHPVIVAHERHEQSASGKPGSSGPAKAHDPHRASVPAPRVAVSLEIAIKLSGPSARRTCLGARQAAR